MARSDKRLRLEKWALYGGLFTLSTQSIKPNYLVIPFTDAAWQFLQKLITLKVEKVINHPGHTKNLKVTLNFGKTRDFEKKVRQGSKI